MNTYIVLLRGINVGGHKKVPMAELRELLTTSGFKDVRTYIQSGNIILNASENESSNIENKIHQAMLSHFGFDVPIIARTSAELKRIFDACPFSEEKKENSYFILLSDLPKIELVEEVTTINYENEEFQIINDCLYFFSLKGYGRTKFNMSVIEKKLNIKATARNYNTFYKVLNLVNG